MTTDYQAVFETFLVESDENFERIEQGLVALDVDPEDPEPLQEVFRHVHTLKGNAASLGFPETAELAHVVEDLLDRVRSRRVPLTAELITLLLASVDALRQQVSSGGGRQAAPEGRRRSSEPVASTTLRIDARKLDRLVDLVGEIAIARELLGARLATLSGPDAAAALDAHASADRLYADLQEAVMSTRMVPLAPQLRSLARVARDAAAALGKRVRFSVQGDAADIDTRTFQMLKAPLTHLVRNAVSHGIEPPERRAALGKDPEGRVSVKARRGGARLLLELSDDGAGVDLARVNARAVELGMVDPAARLSEAQTLALLFQPGFSTAEAVSDLSGRGVGMDVVRRDVEALRGRVDVTSAPGLGTTVSLQLPMTIAVITGLSFVVGGQFFVLPIDAVRECLDVAGAAEGRDGLVNVRGEPLPFLRLRSLFGLAGPAAQRESLVAVEHEGRRAALIVDELRGSAQTVIKPLGRALGHPAGISGSAITRTGHVALILDVATLLQGIARQEQEASRQAP